MKHMKTLLASAVAASSIVAAPAAMAELSASATVASSYLWRGIDLGNGTPAVSGDLTYSVAGFYVGTWVSSGDTAAGTETDFYIGWGGEFGGFSIDLSVWNYVYPTASFDGAVTWEDYTADDALSPDVVDAEDTWLFSRYADNGDTYGDLSEVILSVGFGPVSISYYDNIAGAQGYEYYTIGAGFGPVSVTVGKHDNPTGDDPVHVDLSYAYNDSFTITASEFVSDKGSVDGDTQFVVSYSLPF